MWFLKKVAACHPLLTAVIIMSAALSGADELHFANEHWPPFIIMERPGQASGIDVDLIIELAARMGVGVEITKCDWFYCLKLMENGRVDIISAALKKPEREEYMLYIEPPYIRQSTKLFYLRKEISPHIQKYEDLYQLTIGVLKGSAYYMPFDSDSKIRKVEVLKTEQLLEMLKQGRIDAFIGTEIVTDHLISSLNYDGLFKKSSYRHVSDAPFHLAISRKSPFSKRITEFNNIMASMVEEGRVRAIIEKYIGNIP